MQSNIKEFLRKNKLGSRTERSPVMTFFHSLINSNSYDIFLEKKENLAKKDFKWTGAMAEQKVREYLMKNIVPKIESSSGR